MEHKCRPQKVVQGSGHQSQPHLRITWVTFSKLCRKDSELKGVGRGPGSPVTGQLLGDSRWARFRAESGNKGEQEDTRRFWRWTEEPLWARSV